MIRAYGLAAALICYACDAAACLRSLAGNGRPDSLDALAQVPRDPEPTPPPLQISDITVAWLTRTESTPLYDAAMDFLRRSLAELEAVDTVADFLYCCGEDA